MTVDVGSGDSTWLYSEHWEALRRESQGLRQLSEQARARARLTRYQVSRGRPQREVLRESAFARLQARLESMPVIEQAKGIIMAQQRCGPDEAFDLLRRMSQRANIKLHALATEIVEHVRLQRQPRQRDAHLAGYQEVRAAVDRGRGHHRA